MLMMSMVTTIVGRPRMMKLLGDGGAQDNFTLMFLMVRMACPYCASRLPEQSGYAPVCAGQLQANAFPQR